MIQDSGELIREEASVLPSELGSGEVTGLTVNERLPQARGKPSQSAALASQPSTALPHKESSLNRTKDIFAIVQSAMTIAALLAAGGWFLWQGQNRPRIRVRNEITHRRLAADTQLLVVDVVLANVGSVKAWIPCVRVTVEQIFPEVLDPKLADPDHNCTVSYDKRMAVEPGEDFWVHTEHLIFDDVQIVRVHSFSSLDTGFGWPATSIYNLGGTNPTMVGATAAK
jgi:hypothetical protein